MTTLPTSLPAGDLIQPVTYSAAFYTSSSFTIDAASIVSGFPLSSANELIAAFGRDSNGSSVQRLNATYTTGTITTSPGTWSGVMWGSVLSIPYVIHNIIVTLTLGTNSASYDIDCNLTGVVRENWMPGSGWVDYFLAPGSANTVSIGFDVSMRFGVNHTRKILGPKYTPSNTYNYMLTEQWSPMLSDYGSAEVNGINLSNSHTIPFAYVTPSVYIQFGATSVDSTGDLTYANQGDNRAWLPVQHTDLTSWTVDDAASYLTDRTSGGNLRFRQTQWESTILQYNSGLFRYSGNQWSLPAGTLTVTETPPPDLSTISLSVTSAATDVGGKCAVATQYIDQWSGWRYLSMDVTASTTNNLEAGREPQLFFAVDLNRAYAMGYNLPIAQAYLSAIVNNTGNPDGSWFRVPYDFKSGGTQTVVIDLAAPLWNQALGTTTPQFCDFLGTGLPWVNSCSIKEGVLNHVDNASGQERELNNNGFLTLAVDTYNTTAAISNLQFQTNGSSRLYVMSPSDQQSNEYLATKYSVFKAPCESIGAGNPAMGNLIVVTRDDKPVVALMEGKQGDGWYETYMTATDAITQLNAIGNGYTWSLSSDYDLSVIPFCYILPTIIEFGDGTGFKGTTNIDLVFSQGTIVDKIPWWTLDKQHTIDERTYHGWMRGIVVDDTTGNAFVGKLDGISGWLDANNNFVPHTSPATLTLNTNTNGFFSTAIPPLPPLGMKQAFQFTVGTRQVICLVNSNNIFVGLRLASPSEAHSRYSHSRNAKWVIEADHQGELVAILRNNFTNGSFPIAFRKRLGIKGTSPVIALREADGTCFVAYKRDGQVILAESSDQFSTLKDVTVLFTNAYGEIAIAYDESANCLYALQTCGDPLNPVVTGTTNYVNLQLVRYDGSGNKLSWNNCTGSYSSISCNVLFTMSATAGRPTIEIIPSHRVVIGFGDTYWFSDDSGKTFTSQSGSLLYGTNNFTFSGGTSSWTADGTGQA